MQHARAGMRNAAAVYGPPPRRTAGSSWRSFARRYGWRAYALPVLLVITVAALVRGVHSPTPRTTTSAHRPVVTSGPTAPPTASGSIPLKDDQTGPNVVQKVAKAAALPPGAAYPFAGKGTFHTLRGTTPVVGAGPLHRYEIQVEDGVDDINSAAFAKEVVAVLSDKRSWSGHGVSLERVDSGPVDFRVTLTSAKTVRALCGYALPVETSCYAPAGGASPVNRVVLNDARWVRGSTAYVGDLDAYRIYMINHEDGHALGHEHAHQCLPGGLAPVMMQQTFGLRSAATGTMCQANPWPYPPNVKGAPGAEQPDTPANDEYGLGD
ncbi:DUF3152 domain-containing protein [uncultured Jatrophihabitans sp.]|uniref:DUF3152 domain-containing protein n=1 Tax=uncultured Jatrophihabitans sp. TaxID=1610747 RepID=UPI0035CBAB4C